MANNFPMASDCDRDRDLRSEFQATHDECTLSQPSTASSPFNSFIVEYDLDTLNLNPHTSKEPNYRMKYLTSSGELGAKTALSRHNNQAIHPPPAQFMGSTGEYDPYRIPVSAFATKNAAHVEWSVASNESLFSIQMGNASFNRDHHAFFQKSQELPKHDDMMNTSRGLPQVNEAVDAEGDNTVLHGKQDHLMLNHTPTMVLPGTVEDREKEITCAPVASTAGDGHSSELSSTPRNSNGSNSGVQPFSFPIFENADVRTSLGKLGPAEIIKQKSHLEIQKVIQDNDVVMNSPVAAATIPTAKNTNWFCFPCCRGWLF